MSQKRMKHHTNNLLPRAMSAVDGPWPGAKAYDLKLKLNCPPREFAVYSTASFEFLKGHSIPTLQLVDQSGGPQLLRLRAAS